MSQTKNQGQQDNPEICSTIDNFIEYVKVKSYGFFLLSYLHCASAKRLKGKKCSETLKK